MDARLTVCHSSAVVRSALQGTGTNTPLAKLTEGLQRIRAHPRRWGQTSKCKHAKISCKHITCSKIPLYNICTQTACGSGRLESLQSIHCSRREDAVTSSLSGCSATALLPRLRHCPNLQTRRERESLLLHGRAATGCQSRFLFCCTFPIGSPPAISYTALLLLPQIPRY